MMETLTERTEPARRPALGAVWAAVFASFLIFSAVRSPVPGVNEPHYLGKAKHYWNPAWCEGDFFLESANAHRVFYQSMGFFTQFLTLEQTAWLGRGIGLALLAWGWVRMVSRISPGRWAGLWAAWTYLAFAAVGNWSGEWMIGGIEGKVFAYAFGFWAIAAFLDGHIKRSALLAGLAVSFHPLVGGWMMICGTAAVLVIRFLSRTHRERTDNDSSASLSDWIIAAGIFLLAALPGLWPALELVGSSGDLRQTKIVTWIQVFYRLQHHLDPTTFSPAASASYGLMAVLWLLIRHRLGWGENERWFAWFVGASIAVALIGVALGYGDRPIDSLKDISWRYRLLKFYPFRLADIMLPVAAAITLAGLAERNLSGGLDRLWGSLQSARLRCWLIFASLFLFSLSMPAIDRNPSRMSDEQRQDWLDVCRWIREETPPGSMVWTPRNSWAFKWYAQRAEYVSRKDCPQDDEGIIEWNERMLNNDLGRALREEPRLNYAIYRKGGLTLEPVYQNETYRVYDLSELSRE